MERNFGRLQEEFGEALGKALEETNPVNRCLACIRASESAIARMKEMVVADPFRSKEEEIHHFKFEAPEVYGQLFYYLELVRMETDRAYTDAGSFLVALRRKKEALDEYFRAHDHICRYYYQGFDHFDEPMFVRRSVGQWSGDEIGAFIPPDFTIGTYWVSWIKANDRLRRWIQEELEPGDPTARAKQRKIRWVKSRVDMLEVFCALHLDGCFGDRPIKEVMEWVEEQLGVRVGQFHSSLNDMSIRKDPVQCLHRLTAVMTRKFNSMT
jgi:hypothetical protein